jgi:hypothetical protein
MALLQAIAARQADVRDRIQAAIQLLSEKAGVPVPPPSQVNFRQPELRMVAELERVAAFLESLVGVPSVAESSKSEPSELPPPPDPDDETHDHPDGKWYGYPVADLLKLTRDELISLPRINEARADAFLAKHPPTSN